MVKYLGRGEVAMVLTIPTGCYIKRVSNDLPQKKRRSECFNKYAFTRAHEGRLHHGLFMSILDEHGRARAAWIVLRHSVLADVCDSVLKESKDFVAMVLTQAVARAEILVNPHAHETTLLVRALP